MTNTILAINYVYAVTNGCYSMDKGNFCKMTLYVVNYFLLKTDILFLKKLLPDRPFFRKSVFSILM